MASKLQIITALFNDEVSKVTNSYDNWTSFLKTASNNFKYNLDVDDDDDDDDDVILPPAEPDGGEG